MGDGGQHVRFTVRVRRHPRARRRVRLRRARPGRPADAGRRRRRAGARPLGRRRRAAPGAAPRAAVRAGADHGPRRARRRRLAARRARRRPPVAGAVAHRPCARHPPTGATAASPARWRRWSPAASRCWPCAPTCPPGCRAWPPGWAASRCARGPRWRPIPPWRRPSRTSSPSIRPPVRRGTGPRDRAGVGAAGARLCPADP